jgi:glutamate/tyrosine decarboxylase-like PLP-dependent enzyme
MFLVLVRFKKALENIESEIKQRTLSNKGSPHCRFAEGVVIDMASEMAHFPLFWGLEGSLWEG